MKFLVKPFQQHGFSITAVVYLLGKFHNYLPINEVMKWSAFLGTMSLYLQEQQICDSEIIFERISFFFFNFRVFFSLSVPFEEISS